MPPVDEGGVLTLSRVPIKFKKRRRSIYLYDDDEVPLNLIARAMSTICDTTKLNRRGFVVEKSFYKFVNNEIPRARRKPTPRTEEKFFEPPERGKRARVRGDGWEVPDYVLIHRYYVDNVVVVVFIHYGVIRA